MLKKLHLDAVSSEVSAVKKLLVEASKSGDIVGELQWGQKLAALTSEVEILEKEVIQDTEANVALLFGGKPVLGSKGIAAEFAGQALEKFQNLVSKTFAVAEIGDLGQRGKVPFKEQSDLMITGLARGSFGFVLSEISDQASLESSELAVIVERVSSVIKDTAAADESLFEELVSELNPRTLIALREFFLTLDSNQATVRIVERNRDFILDNTAIHRGRLRTEATSIEEDTIEVAGLLVGFLPDHRKFEIKDQAEEIIYGSVSKTAVEQFQNASSTVIGKRCLAKLNVRTIEPLNRPPRKVNRLLEFLRLGLSNNDITKQ